MFDALAGAGGGGFGVFAHLLGERGEGGCERGVLGAPVAVAGAVLEDVDEATVCGFLRGTGGLDLRLELFVGLADGIEEARPFNGVFFDEHFDAAPHGDDHRLLNQHLAIGREGVAKSVAVVRQKQLVAVGIGSVQHPDRREFEFGRRVFQELDYVLAWKHKHDIIT